MIPSCLCACQCVCAHLFDPWDSGDQCVPPPNCTCAGLLTFGSHASAAFVYWLLSGYPPVDVPTVSAWHPSALLASYCGASTHVRYLTTADTPTVFAVSKSVIAPKATPVVCDTISKPAELGPRLPLSTAGSSVGGPASASVVVQSHQAEAVSEGHAFVTPLAPAAHGSKKKLEMVRVVVCVCCVVVDACMCVVA